MCIESKSVFWKPQQLAIARRTPMRQVNFLRACSSCEAYDGELFQEFFRPPDASSRRLPIANVTKSDARSQ